MKNIYWILIAVWFSLFSLTGYSQIDQGGSPFSFQNPVLVKSAVAVEQMPKTDINRTPSMSLNDELTSSRQEITWPDSTTLSGENINGLDLNSPTLLSVSPSGQLVTSAPGSITFNVSCNFTWTGSSNQAWCIVTQSGTGYGAIIVTYDENNGDSRIANITVTTPGLSPVIVTVTQMAGQNSVQKFDSTLVISGSKYYLKDKIANRNAMLIDAPCLATKTSCYADLSSVRWPTNDTSYRINTGDSVQYEFEFNLLAAPSVNYWLYENGQSTTTDPGVRIQVNTDRTIYVLIGDATGRDIWYTSTFTGKLAIGYNKVVININTTANNGWVKIITSGTYSKNNTITKTGSHRNTYAYLLAYESGYALPCNLIRFKFTKNNVALHEYFFNDGIKKKIPSVYYIVPDLIGSFDLYLAGFTGYPFTGVQNTNFYLQEHGYHIYAKKQYPDTVYIYPQRINYGYPGDTISYAATRFDHIERVDSSKFCYYAWNKIDMNPSDSTSNTFYDKWDVTNRSYWKSAVSSDPFYDAANKYHIHKSWLNKTKLDAYTVGTYIHADKGQFNFYDVGEVHPRKLEDVKLYSSAVTRSAGDVNYNKKLTDIYFKRPLKTGTTTGYLLAIKGNKYLYRDGDYLYLSTDKGITYGTGYNTSAIITPSVYNKYYILNTGTILAFPFGAKHIYRSSDDNATWTESTYQTIINGDSIFKSRVNPAYPGNYFCPMATGLVDTTNMIVVGNYANADGYGAAPVTIWYSTNDGVSWKVAYMFGQQSTNTDNGTANGGTGGKPQGDPNNPTMLASHVHGIARNHYDGSYWVFCGDGTTHNHWMKGTYISGTDKWTWADQKNPANNAYERFRTINPYFKNADTLVVCADGIDASNEIMWNVPIHNINNMNAWVPITSFPNKTSVIFFLKAFPDGRMLVVNAKEQVYFSENFGSSWTRVRFYTDESGYTTVYLVATGLYEPNTDDWILGPEKITTTGGMILLKNSLTPIFDVSPSTQSVASVAGTIGFMVTSNSAWTTSSNQSWCTVTPSGTGTGTMTANYTLNPTTSIRVDSITVTVPGLTPVVVTITQAGAIPTLTVTPINKTVGPAGGITSFTVTSNTNWTVSCNQSWCSVTSSGFGNGMITCNYAVNDTASSRIANITVAVSGLTPVLLTLIQAAPTLSVTPDHQDVPNTSGETTFTVTSNTNWTASSDQDWCIVTSSGNGSGTLSATYLPNLTDSSRLASLTVNVTGLSSVVVRVSQVSAFIKTFYLQVVLEGFYIGNHHMHPVMNASSYVWGPQIIDKMTIELHNGSNYSNIVYTATDVSLHTNGAASFALPSSYNGDYYVTVINRNHILTTSARPISFSSSTINYAFDAPEKAYGGNLVLMNDGTYVFYAGDENQDGEVDGYDLSGIGNLVDEFATGYMKEDINGDGTIDGYDLAIAGNNVDNFVGAMTP